MYVRSTAISPTLLHNCAYNFCKLRSPTAIFNMLLLNAIYRIPKSIDNDIDLIDRSFGFMTAVEAAQDAIRYTPTAHATTLLLLLLLVL
jgi:Phosphofructokinase